MNFKKKRNSWNVKKKLHCWNNIFDLMTNKSSKKLEHDIFEIKFFLAKPSSVWDSEVIQYSKHPQINNELCTIYSIRSSNKDIYVPIAQLYNDVLYVKNKFKTYNDIFFSRHGKVTVNFTPARFLEMILEDIGKLAKALPRYSASFRDDKSFLIEIRVSFLF